MPKDLQKDKAQFCLYTIKWATGIETLVENHCSELLTLLNHVGTDDFGKVWKETYFCKDCLISHSKELMAYASEAVTGEGCGDLKAWEDLQKTASDLHDYLLPLNEAEDYTKDTKTKIEELLARLRTARKKIEDAGVQFATFDKKDNIEHIT